MEQKKYEKPVAKVTELKMKGAVMQSQAQSDDD